MIKKTIPYSTERLLIMPVSVADAAFILELLNTPKWIQHIGDRKVRTEKDAVAYIKKKMYPQFKKLGYGNYLIMRKSDGKKIGTCGLYDRDGLDGIDIGFAMLPEHYGQGYGFEASNCIKNIGIEDFGIRTISGITIKENIASQRLLEKLGLTFRELIRIPNDDEELMLYRLEV